jgi:Cu+-exporting ATPase
MEGLLGDMQSEGMTTVLLAREDANGAMLLAVFGIEDQVRPEATELISDLMGRGVRCVMMTGDNRRTAAAVASKVGLDEWFAEVQPDDKAQRVIAYQAEGRKVAMVGDGINDSPALACASLGIAIGSGTDIARETAGVTLLRHDIRLVAETLRLGVLTMSKIRQNLFWAFAYNVTLVPLAMIGMMAPMFAGAAMALSSLSVVINSLAMRRGETKR